MNDINSEALVSGVYRTKATLDTEAKKAGQLVDLGVFAIPNQFLGGVIDLRSDDQKAAQTAPGEYMQAMQKFFEELNKALNKAVEQR